MQTIGMGMFICPLLKQNNSCLIFIISIYYCLIVFLLVTCTLKKKIDRTCWTSKYRYLDGICPDMLWRDYLKKPVQSNVSFIKFRFWWFCVLLLHSLIYILYEILDRIAYILIHKFMTWILKLIISPGMNGFIFYLLSVDL